MDYGSNSGDALGGLLGGGTVCCFYIFYFALIGVLIASMWKLYAKAGRPGWAAIVPIYNIMVLLEIVGRPAWWVLLYFVPIVNVVISFMVAIDLAKSFGKDVGYALGLIFLSVVFYPMLGFGSAQYVGPAAAGAAAPPPPSYPTAPPTYTPPAPPAPPAG